MSPELKKALSVFWHATMRGCTLAIAILFVFFTIMSIATSISGKSEQGMNLSSMMTLTVFALVVSYAKEIFNAKTMPAPAQWAVNFLVVGIAYFVVVLRSGMLAPTSSSFYVTGGILYVLAYLIVMGITLLVKRIMNKKDPSTVVKEEYVSRFN